MRGECVQKRAQFLGELGRALALLEKVLECLPTDAPVFAELYALQTSLLTPTVDSNRTHPEIPCNILGAQQVLLFVRSLVHSSHYYSSFRRLFDLLGHFRPFRPFIYFSLQ